MPTGITSSVAFRNSAFSGGRIAFLDSGAGHAYFELYDGTRPASGGAVTTKLATVDLAKPCASVSGGMATLLAGADTLAIATGTPTWARFFNGNGDWAFDCDASVVGGGGQVTVPSVPLYAGGTTSLASGALTQP